MGFVSVTCTNCAGEGLITAQATLVPEAKLCKVTCNECEGSGSHLVHAGSIRSYEISVDPAGANENDEAWAVMWTRHDNDVIEVVDMFDLNDRTKSQRTLFDRFR